uniref:Uncharacterized protein n=1 Tax=Romanomermis culicivorax TaxID=13658 RepID=A0A915KE06_ROMCU
MATFNIVEVDNSFGQPQDCQDNTNFQISSTEMEQEKPVVVIIADPPITDTLAAGNEGAAQEEKLMEINVNAEEERTSEEPYVEVISEIGSDDETPETNVLTALPVYAKAGGQN